MGELTSPKALSGRDFQRVEIFSTAESTPRYMLTHIKIRLGRIKGLKGLFYVLSSRTGCALPATKVDSFFVMVIIRHHANSRQQMTLKPQVHYGCSF